MIYSRSPGWQSPQEQKNVSPAPYPWRKLYSCKNKTFLGPTFPFPWSSGLSSLAALGRQLSCRSRKVKSCPSESLVLTWIHSFRGKVRGIYILRMPLPGSWKTRTGSTNHSFIQLWTRGWENRFPTSWKRCNALYDCWDFGLEEFYHNITLNGYIIKGFFGCILFLYS